MFTDTYTVADQIRLGKSLRAFMSQKPQTLPLKSIGRWWRPGQSMDARIWRGEGRHFNASRFQSNAWPGRVYKTAEPSSPAPRGRRGPVRPRAITSTLSGGDSWAAFVSPIPTDPRRPRFPSDQMPFCIQPSTGDFQWTGRQFPPTQSRQPPRLLDPHPASPVPVWPFLADLRAISPSQESNFRRPVEHGTRLRTWRNASMAPPPSQEVKVILKGERET